MIKSKKEIIEIPVILEEYADESNNIHYNVYGDEEIYYGIIGSGKTAEEAKIKFKKLLSSKIKFLERFRSKYSKRVLWKSNFVKTENYIHFWFTIFGVGLKINIRLKPRIVETNTGFNLGPVRFFKINEWKIKKLKD